MRKSKNSFYNRYVKRILDIICAILSLLLFGWLLIILAVLVRVKLGSPVLFRQLRPGKDGKVFWMIKFRTMTDDRDENGNLLPDAKRMTIFGKFLRDTSLDELPEILCILRGTMSFVGPRPQLIRDMMFMSEEQNKRHEVRPGLTGLAQVRGRNALEWEAKLSSDVEYTQKISFATDMKIIWMTVKQVVFRKKYLSDSTVDEVALTDDFGDYLLKKGLVTEEEYEQKTARSKKFEKAGLTVKL